jgi:hypothetical protein
MKTVTLFITNDTPGDWRGTIMVAAGRGYEAYYRGATLGDLVAAVKASPQTPRVWGRDAYIVRVRDYDQRAIWQDYKRQRAERGNPAFGRRRLSIERINYAKTGRWE